MSKDSKGYCKQSKDSLFYNLPPLTQWRSFHHPKILRLASGTNHERMLNIYKKHYHIGHKNVT